jgi:hypothetical protein
MKKIVLLFCISLFMFGCIDISENDDDNSNGVYALDPSIDTITAFLAIEWSGKPYIVASGFLIDKEKGVFLTAKHFTDSVGDLGANTCKLFFNGIVYDAYVIKVPPLRDAAAIRISGAFDSSRFPEPLPISKSNLEIGQDIMIEGYHIHSYRIRASNADDGLFNTLIPIMRDYYMIPMNDLRKESEVVFEILNGEITGLEEKVNIKTENGGSWDQGLKDIRYESNTYIQVRTERNHKFSFGGLSGTVATTIEEGEKRIAGLITAEAMLRLDYDEDGFLVNPDDNNEPNENEDSNLRDATLTTIADTISITPIGALNDLRDYVRSIR